MNPAGEELEFKLRLYRPRPLLLPLPPMGVGVGDREKVRRAPWTPTFYKCFLRALAYKGLD